MSAPAALNSGPFSALEDKLDRLSHRLHQLGGAVVAFSGGADSAFLAEVAHRALGARSVAVTADSPSLPARELAEAAALAAERGWLHRVVATGELEDERYASNPSNRCCFCKQALMDRLGPIANSLGFVVLLGTNTDDLSDWRPGQQAATKRGAEHPLADAGFSKADVRAASVQMGLPTADKPAAACLASRFAYGVRVTRQGLARVERSEAWLMAEGFKVVRVRDLGNDRARLEVPGPDVRRLRDHESQVRAQLNQLGFQHVEIDERGYRQGAMNELLAIGGPSR